MTAHIRKIWKWEFYYDTEKPQNTQYFTWLPEDVRVGHGHGSREVAASVLGFKLPGHKLGLLSLWTHQQERLARRHYYTSRNTSSLCLIPNNVWLNWIVGKVNPCVSTAYMSMLKVSNNSSTKFKNNSLFIVLLVYTRLIISISSIILAN